MIIKTHRELASFIKNKKILHLNSLGKDSAACLEWLNNFAAPSKIVSVHFEFFAPTPWDKIYLAYQKKRYPKTEFITVANPLDLSNIYQHYQSPIDILNEFNKWEYEDFSLGACSQDILERYKLDFMCLGHARYESVTRASTFHKKGLVQDDTIYPIGMMSKDEVLGVLKASGVKLHPVYKFMSSTPDYPSYYKMRSLFLASPKFKKLMYSFYPLLALDEYRYTRLFNEKI